MGSHITLTLSLIFIALFSIAIVGFALGFAEDNNAFVDISDDPNVSGFYTTTQSDLSTFKSQSEESYKSILQTNVETGSDVPPSSAPFEITVKNLVGTGTNVIFLPLQSIFGGKEGGFGVFFTVFGGLIALLFILYVYKTWRGNP